MFEGNKFKLAKIDVVRSEGPPLLKILHFSQHLRGYFKVFIFNNYGKLGWFHILIILLLKYWFLKECPRDKNDLFYSTFIVFYFAFNTKK